MATSQAMVGALGDTPLLESHDGTMRDTVLISDERCGAQSLAGGLVWVAPGERIHEDTHPFDEAYYVVRGEATLVGDGKPLTMKAGDVVCIPAGVSHYIQNSADTVFEIFWCIGTRWEDLKQSVAELGTWPHVDSESGWHVA
jgi:quercetin dioxygenase-like cupin family protein